jgi:hypothetical protein
MNEGMGNMQKFSFRIRVDLAVLVSEHFKRALGGLSRLFTYCISQHILFHI